MKPTPNPNRQVKIVIQSAYGREFIRPANETAEAFARIASAKSLTRGVLFQIAKLGYEIIEVFPQRFQSSSGGDLLLPPTDC